MIGDRFKAAVERLQSWKTENADKPKIAILTPEMKANAKALLLPIVKPMLIEAVPQLATIEALIGDQSALTALIAEVIREGLAKLRAEPDATDKPAA